MPIHRGALRAAPIAIPRAGPAVMGSAERADLPGSAGSGCGESGAIERVMHTFRVVRSPAKDPGTPSYAELPPEW